MKLIVFVVKLLFTDSRKWDYEIKKYKEFKKQVPKPEFEIKLKFKHILLIGIIFFIVVFKLSKNDTNFKKPNLNEYIKNKYHNTKQIIDSKYDILEVWSKLVVYENSDTCIIVGRNISGALINYSGDPKHYTLGRLENIVDILDVKNTKFEKDFNKEGIFITKLDFF